MSSELPDNILPQIIGDNRRDITIATSTRWVYRSVFGGDSRHGIWNPHKYSSNFLLMHTRPSEILFLFLFSWLAWPTSQLTASVRRKISKILRIPSEKAENRFRHQRHNLERAEKSQPILKTGHVLQMFQEKCSDRVPRIEVPCLYRRISFSCLTLFFMVLWILYS